MAELSRDRIHEPSLLLALVLVVLVGVAFVVSDEAIAPLYAASLVIAIGFLLGSAYEPVRNDDRYHVGKTLVVTVLFGIWWLDATKPAIFPAVLTVAGALGILVELYNLRAGTTYLRVG